MNLNPRPHQARFGVPAHTRQAIVRAVREGLQPLKAEPPQRLADWAADHFQLSSDNSHQQGKWQAWPFQVGWMDAFSNDDIEQVDVQKAKRVGYTKTLVAYVAYNAAHRHRKQALWQPTDDDRDSFVKTEIEPMLDQVAAVRAVRRRTRGAEDSIKLKAFLGSLAHFLGGKAARAYRRITVDAVELDEIDGFDQTIEKSADPVTLAKGRLEGAPHPKCIVGSTPRLKGFSHIERQVESADARLRYRIPCVYCGAEHPLLWGGKNVAHGFKWDKGAAKPESTAHHVCPHCHGSISQAQYLKVWEQGAWVCDRTGVRYGADRVWRNDRGEPIRAPRHVAFTHVWAAYSPQRTWTDIVREWLEAHAAQRRGENGPAQGFTNETLAQTWEEAYEHTEKDELTRRAKAEAFPLGVVPRGACVLKNAVDVQGDRWEMVTWAFGRGQEMWAIDYRVIYGNTADQAEWDAKVEPLIGLSYPTVQGTRLACNAMAVDTGFQTHQAYAFARKHRDRNVHATKGDSKPGKPIKARRTLQDMKHNGRVLRRGVAVWFVGTDTAKDLIHGRLQLAGDGPGRMHFAADLPDTFFSGLTAEQRVPVRTDRGLEHRWDCPSGRRNEPLDCTVYCLFLAELENLGNWTDRQWLRAEQILVPDLFDAASMTLPVPTAVALEKVPAATAPKSRPRPAPPPPVLASEDWSARV